MDMNHEINMNVNTDVNTDINTDVNTDINTVLKWKNTILEEEFWTEQHYWTWVKMGYPIVDTVYSLSLSKNKKLKFIPKQINNLISLNMLSISETDIESLPSTIGDLIYLDCLYVYDNVKLKTLFFKRSSDLRSYR